jgi:hypothetical protein
MLELSELVASDEFAQRARHPDFPNAFTRRRKLPLPALIAALPTMRASSQQPAEIDFSKGARGQFFSAGARLSLPVYLEADVQDYLAARALARGIEVGQLVNELLKKDIELIEAAR